MVPSLQPNQQPGQLQDLPRRCPGARPPQGVDYDQNQNLAAHRFRHQAQNQNQNQHLRSSAHSPPAVLVFTTAPVCWTPSDGVRRVPLGPPFPASPDVIPDHDSAWELICEGTHLLPLGCLEGRLCGKEGRYPSQGRVPLARRLLFGQCPFGHAANGHGSEDLPNAERSLQIIRNGPMPRRNGLHLLITGPPNACHRAIQQAQLPNWLSGLDLAI